MLDAGQRTKMSSKPQSQDVDEHFGRFLDGKYSWKRFLLFNFALSEGDFVLPREESGHEQCYTFLRSTNTLYRGKNIIKTSAVPKLSGGGEPESLHAINRVRPPPPQ